MMNKIKKVVLIAICFCLCFGCIAIQPDTVSAKSEAAKLSVSSVTIAMGGTQTVKLSKGFGKWSTENSDIATVSSNTGKSVKVIPEKAGKTTVVCNASGKKMKCKVTVLNSSAGDVEDDRPHCMPVGHEAGAYIGDECAVEDIKYDKNILYAEVFTDDGEQGIYIKGLKSGFSSIEISFENGSKKYLDVRITPGFRTTKTKKTEANYKKWRRNWINEVVTEDMNTWEIIDAIGYLISSGDYGLKGGATGLQLWYGGNGTCVSGAKMMNDFMGDIGIDSKIHFAGNDGIERDIYGYSVSYGSGHKNTHIKINGNKYTLNPQPEGSWPMGIIKK